MTAVTTKRPADLFERPGAWASIDDAFTSLWPNCAGGRMSRSLLKIGDGPWSLRDLLIVTWV